MLKSNHVGEQKKQRPNCFILFYCSIASKGMTAEVASDIWKQMSDKEKQKWRDAYSKNTDGQKSEREEENDKIYKILS